MLLPEPAETFRWGEQPIAFSPPPKSWTRERHAEGGRQGVSFTRYAVPPSRIIVAEASVSPPPTTVEEILPTFRLTAARFPSAESVTVAEPVRAVVAGYPAFQTDYTLRERSMLHRGCEFVTVAGGRAFVFSFLGPVTDLRALENLVASVRFPAAVDSTGAGGDPLFHPTPVPGGSTEGHEIDLLVGAQRMTVRLPDPWEHIDYGERQEFRRGETRIALVDGGEIPRDTGGVDDDRLVERALRLFGHDERRREVASRTYAQVGGRDALVVDTWDPLSHGFRRRCVLVSNAGRLLVASTVQGTFEETEGPLDALVRSIRFPD